MVYIGHVQVSCRSSGGRTVKSYLFLSWKKQNRPIVYVRNEYSPRNQNDKRNEILLHRLHDLFSLTCFPHFIPSLLPMIGKKNEPPASNYDVTMTDCSMAAL